jgi:uncharacterized protein (DUF983 family)
MNLGAILRQRCPRCLKGAMFSGLLTTRERCDACALRFEREPGYFVGALYVSYALAVAVMALLFLLIRWLRPLWPDIAVVCAALPPFLPLVPLIVRYSKVIWVHLDRRIDPES